MRINYYRFPEGVDAKTRHDYGAEGFSFICDAESERWADENNMTPSEGCPSRDGCYGCRDCSHRVCTEADDTLSGISVGHAKDLLKKLGGVAWTDHCERDGGVFETTEIKLTGNNSRFKYSRHL